MCTSESDQGLLPLFPLELVVFPSEALRLHIFELRYKQLIHECEEEGITFGIPAYRDGRIAEYGTEMRLVSILKEYEGGEMDILTEGLQVFHLDRFVTDVPEKLYAGGEVSRIENDSGCYGVTIEELISQYQRLHAVLKTDKPRESFQGANLSFQLGHEVGLELGQKLELLATPKEADRQLYIVEHLHKTIPVLQAAEETRKRISQNGNVKHLRELEF
jgi:hypothetical protein